MSLSALLAIGMGRSPSKPYVDRKRLRIIEDLMRTVIVFKEKITTETMKDMEFNHPLFMKEDDMPARKPKTKKAKREAAHEVMGEFKRGTLHSGSKSGPKVKSRRQAVAIALSESGQSKKKKKRAS